MSGFLQFARALDRRPGRALAAVLLITALLAVPFLTMAPTESASTEPGGRVFDARDRIDGRFVSSVRPVLLIAEHEGEDVLLADPLRELLAAQQALRNDSEVGPGLFTYFEVETQTQVVGIQSFADLVAGELAASGVAIESATDREVKDAGTVVIERFGERSSVLGLSAQSEQAENGDWIVPALQLVVLTDDTLLGFGNVSVNLGGGTEVEEFDRDIQGILRGAAGYQVNGVAIDVNLTSQEQGAVAGPFIGFTILAVLVIVGLTFRSYWTMAVVGVALLALIIWLKGISNLIGLKDDLVLSLIVPVAMVSFGVDFAFHSIGRYREERANGAVSSPAFVAGLTAVSGALLLALTSDTVAFLSNLSSGIESINQFGLGAGIALAAAYVLLGVMAPLAISKIEQQVPAPAPGRRSTMLRVLAGLGAAGMTMASVLLLVFVLPWLGLVLSVMTVLVTLVGPFLVRRRASGVPVGAAPTAGGDDALAKPVGAGVAALARRPLVVLPAALALSAVAGFFALQVPAVFDVEDFFSSDTDFVVGLDQVDEHIGDRGGEPALLYVEGDLGDPEVLGVVASRLDEIRALDAAGLAREADGSVRVLGGVFTVFNATWDSPVMGGLVLEQTGVSLSDDNGDGIPDTREQVEALLAVAEATGVPFDAERLALTPDDVAVAVDLSDTPATVFELNLTDTRSQESVAAAREALAPIVAALSADLDDSFVELTGSPIVREASLDATNRALSLSLPIALVLCFLVATTFLRSLRYGFASVVPILMVVSWLYGFMEVAGYGINIVTATIAAVSIGIGIDFAIHFIARYREELDRHGLRSVAVQIAGEGTGTALLASAFSSAVGFGILAFAPMPLFAAYGFLTAVMIGMALIATLAVLPSLLVLLTSDQPVKVLDLDASQGKALVGKPEVGELMGA